MSGLTFGVGALAAAAGGICLTAGGSHLHDSFTKSAKKSAQVGQLTKEVISGSESIRRSRGLVTVAHSSDKPDVRMGGRMHVSVNGGERIQQHVEFGDEMLVVGERADLAEYALGLGGMSIAVEGLAVTAQCIAPPSVKLWFDDHNDALQWADGLREAAKQPHHGKRMAALITQVHELIKHQQDLERMQIGHEMASKNLAALELEEKRSMADSRSKILENELCSTKRKVCEREMELSVLEAKLDKAQLFRRTRSSLASAAGGAAPCGSAVGEEGDQEKRTNETEAQAAPTVAECNWLKSQMRSLEQQLQDRMDFHRTQSSVLQGPTALHILPSSAKSVCCSCAQSSPFNFTIDYKEVWQEEFVKVAEKMALTAGVSKETFQIELFTILDCHATEVTVDGEPSKDQFPLNAQYTPHKAIQLQLADAEARCEQLEEKLSQAPQRVHANLEGTSLPATQDMAKLKQQVNDLMSEVSEANIARQQAEANSQLLMRPAFCDNGSEHIAPPMDVLGEVGLFLVKCYDLDRIGLEENSVGLGYRCSPNLEDRRGSQYPDVVPETYVPWGSVVTASSVGENWVKTEQGYLPIKLRGETVLSKMEGVQLNESVAGRFFEERRGISLDIAEINEDSSCFKDVPVSVQYAAAPPVQYAAAPPVQYAAAPPVMNAAAPTLSAASAVYSEAELPEQPKASELADALGDSLEDLRGIAQKHSDEVSAMMEALDASKATHAQQMEELSLSLRAATSHNEQLQADIVRLQEQKDTGADDQLELAAVSAAKQAMEHELFGATARIGELQEDLHHMTQEAEKIQRMDDERRRHETTIQTLTEQQHRLEEDLHHAHSDRGAMQVHCVSFEEELVRFREENTSVLEEARRQGSQQATHEMDAACREATQRHARAEEAAEAYASRVSELEQGFAAKDEELREKADLHAGIIQDHREAAFVSEQRLRDHTAMLEEKIEQLQESSSLPMTPRASGAVEELSNALKAASMQNEQLQTEIVRLQWTHPQWKGASAANDPSSVAVREQNKAMDQELSRAHTQISLLQAELDDMAEAAEQVRCNDDERSSNEKAIQIVLAEHHQFEEALRNAHSDREAVQSRSVLFQEELLMLSEDKGNVELEKGRGQDVPHAVLSQLEAACLDATKRNAQAEHALATHASRTWELQQGFTERESELRHNALATERKLQDAEVNNELLTKEFQTKCAAVEHHEALHEQEKDSLRAQMRSLEAQVAAQATEFQQRLAATGVGTQELENVFMERLLLSEEKLRAADKKRTEMEGRAAMLENQFKIVKQTDELGKAEESDDRVMQMAGRMAEMQQEMAQIKLALQAGQVKSTSGDDEKISQNALENAELKGRLAGAKDSVVNVTRKLEEERATMWEEMEQRTIQVGVTSRATVTCSNTLSNTLSPSMPMRKTSSPQSIYNSAPMTSPSRGLLMGSASFPISPGTSAAAPTVVAPLPAPSATSAYPPVTWNHLTGTRDVQTTPYSSRSHLDVPSALGSSRGGTASHVGTVYAGGGTGSARGPISARVIAGGIGGQNNVGPTMVVHRSPLEGPSQTQQLAQQPLQAGGPFLGRIEGDRTWMVAHMPQR